MLLIKNARLVDMAGTWKEKRDILIKDGRFLEILPCIEEKADYEMLDAGGRLVTPGFIESHCHLGLTDCDGQDINEKTDPIHPALRAIDALDFDSADFTAALKTGVTTLAVGPGSSNLIGGTFAVIKSAGTSAVSRIVKEELCIKMALGENPKGNYGPKGKMPATRMGETALIRDTLYKAMDYRTRIKEGKPGSFDLNMQSLMRVFDGMPVKIHVHKTNDIMAAIRIGEEFGLNYTLEHCTEGYMLLKELKKAGVISILGPIAGGKGKLELAGKRYDAPALFEREGLPFAITTDSGVIPMEGLLMQVCLLIKHGLSEMGAYKGLTEYAAKAIGLWDEIGSIEPGKQADLVIWDEAPFSTRAKAGTVMIAGKVWYSA
ncbi:MAG: amidohydrolase family protein [bacterium]|nr:amidohydrolase family protein [bacterium]